MKLKSLFSVLFLNIILVINFSHAQTWDQIKETTKNNSLQIENINQNLSDLKNNYRLLYDGATNQNDQLSQQISSTNNLIAILSFLVTIAGVFLSIFIENRYRNIKKIQNIIKETKDYVDKHNSDLYERIKKDETVNLLNRLIKVPEDIGNVCELLLGRDYMGSDCFELLLTAYKKVITEEDLKMYKNQYLIVFSQHFPYESLKSEIKEDFIEYLSSTSVYSMFWNDLENYTKGVLKYVQEKGENIILSKLLQVIWRSKFNNNKNLPNLFSEIKKVYVSDLKSLTFDEAVVTTDEDKKTYIEWLNKYEN